jgi:DNA-binding response OmpR family regulator
MAKQAPGARAVELRLHEDPRGRRVRLAGSRGPWYPACVGLLLVEDNARLAASLARGLGEDGFEVDAVATGAAALSRLADRGVDAMVLDLGLPDQDGLEVLAAARAAGVLAPILVLTARDAVEVRVQALEQGADDFLIKPFAYAELLARIRALLRRAAAPRWAPLSCGDLVVGAAADDATLAGRRLALSPREHDLLELLMRRRGEALARADILREVFGYAFDPGTNLVDVHVANLRKKLGAAPVRIETVRGVGYRLRAVDGDV